MRVVTGYEEVLLKQEMGSAKEVARLREQNSCWLGRDVELLSDVGAMKWKRFMKRGRGQRAVWLPKRHSAGWLLGEGAISSSQIMRRGAPWGGGICSG